MNADRAKKDGSVGILRGIAHRPTDSDPMREVPEAAVFPGRGISAENRKSGKREITLLSTESWTDVCRELGVSLPWSIRRANVLIEGIDLGETIGKQLRIGEVRLQVHGETRPCGLMDQQHQGLRDALIPHCRGGVFAEVLVGGAIRVGDRVEVTVNATGHV